MIADVFVRHISSVMTTPQIVLSDRGNVAITAIAILEEHLRIVLRVRNVLDTVALNQRTEAWWNILFELMDQLPRRFDGRRHI